MNDSIRLECAEALHRLMSITEGAPRSRSGRFFSDTTGAGICFRIMRRQSRTMSALYRRDTGILRVAGARTPARLRLGNRAAPDLQRQQRTVAPVPPDLIVNVKLPRPRGRHPEIHFGGFTSRPGSLSTTLNSELLISI